MMSNELYHIYSSVRNIFCHRPNDKRIELNRIIILA